MALHCFPPFKNFRIALEARTMEKSWYKQDSCQETDGNRRSGPHEARDDGLGVEPPGGNLQARAALYGSPGAFQELPGIDQFAALVASARTPPRAARQCNHEEPHTAATSRSIRADRSKCSKNEPGACNVARFRLSEIGPSAHRSIGLRHENNTLNDTSRRSFEGAFRRLKHFRAQQLAHASARSGAGDGNSTRSLTRLLRTSFPIQASRNGLDCGLKSSAWSTQAVAGDPKRAKHIHQQPEHRISFRSLSVY